MIIEPVNPDLRSVLAQIEEGGIDLDPEFQRGDVWNKDKQQLLVDTILRNWKIPPIFLIKSEDGWGKEVLDGHQRLQAIRLFCHDQFQVNGNLDPIDDEIRKLHGLTFSQLPERIQRNFKGFSLNTFEISNYEESEPFELFYRLNMNAVLTSAERRNTFFGPAREDTKKLVKLMETLGYSSKTIGFNNTRLGYNDIIARVLFSVEQSNISKKINDKDITRRYRKSQEFNKGHIIKIECALKLLIECICDVGKIRFNKASLFSMLIFILYAVKDNVSKSEFCKFLYAYNEFLNNYKKFNRNNEDFQNLIYGEYANRISISVNDAKSVVFRHYFFCWLSKSSGLSILNDEYSEKYEEFFQKPFLDEDSASLSEVLIDCGWGDLRGI